MGEKRMIAGRVRRAERAVRVVVSVRRSDAVTVDASACRREVV